MTLIKDRMHEAGFDRLRFDAAAFCRNFMNSGGTLDLWNEIGAEVAEEMVERGHAGSVQADHVDRADLRHQSGEQDHQTCVSDDHIACVQPSHPKSSEGQSCYASDGQTSSADARPPMPGEDQGGLVQQDHHPSVHAGQPVASGEANHVLPEKATVFVPPAREPRSIVHNQAPSPERMRAVRAAGHTTVPTIFERFKCPDQVTPIGMVRVPDLEGWANSSLRFASLFRRIGALAVKRGKLGPAYTVKDVLSAKELEKVITDSGVVLEGRLTKGVLLQADGTLLSISGSAA